MKKIYASLLFITAGLLAGPAQARYYTFSDAAGGLSSYKQDFNTLAGSLTLMGNQLNSLPEVYAEAEFSGYPFRLTTIEPSDGANSPGNYYHFGYASGAGAGDRSFGGIAAIGINNGIGYAGIRFKNATSVTIQNLEVQYAMEQWYNSGRQDAAQVDVSYLTGSSVASLLEATGAWVSVPALQVKAPSTATVIASRDGNSAANRRLVSTTIMGINLAPGQEVMLRWAYALSVDTNGNGLSIDDVVVTPETGIFYSKTTGDLSDITSWGQNTDGTGTAPASFIGDNQVFYIMGASPDADPAYMAPPSVNATADRVGSVPSPAVTSWTVSGANSKIVVGSASAPATLLIDDTKNITGTIDVSPGSFLVTRRTNSPAFTLGVLASSSVVEYNSNTTPHSIQPDQYGNLKITGSGSSRSANPKNLVNTTIVTSTLTVGSGSNLVLGDNDLTVISSGSITGSATGYVVTNGQGRLRMLVPRASATAVGAQVAFPIGSSFISYTPLTLQQTTATSDDVFEVRVIDNAYDGYDASSGYAPTGPATTNQVVNKTWLVSKEVPDNAANVTMTTQWNAGESSSNFANATAHINHYTGGAWDSYNAEVGATGTAGTGPYVVKRSNITSFSPFGVSSQPAGPLPVVLTTFTAQRGGAGVRCAWATASEVNSRGFDVERSLDGHSFTTLGTVAAAGTSATTHAYAFLDAHAPTTTAYYRLRQLDLDGTAAYSPVVAIEALAGVAPAAGVAFPNPTAGPLTIWAGADVTQAEVLSVLGASVLKQQLAAPTPQVALDLSSLPAGVYLVRLVTASGAQVVRVNKQ